MEEDYGHLFKKHNSDFNSDFYHIQEVKEKLLKI